MIYRIFWKDEVKHYEEKKKHTVGNIVYFSKISLKIATLGNWLLV